MEIIKVLEPVLNEAHLQDRLNHPCQTMFSEDFSDWPRIK